MILLKVSDLSIDFSAEQGRIKAISRLSFEIKPNEIVAIVGESGSGKSVSVMSLLQLLPTPPAKISSGYADFEGKDLLKMNSDEMRSIRGNEISMIFQEPMTSLNPYLTIGDQLVEALITHDNSVSTEQAKSRVITILEKVQIPDAKNRFEQYPHEFSGGMRQRVMIAMALLTKPKLLIADEPTTALDVTVQAEILSLMKTLQDEFKMSILLITHDLGVVSEFANRVYVLEKGELKEKGPTKVILKEPKDDYTKKLIDSLPEKLQTNSNQSKVNRDSTPILTVSNLHSYYEKKTGIFFRRSNQVLKAVQGVQLELFEGEILGLVGESGCGKSTLSKTIIGLKEFHKGHIDLNSIDKTKMQMIFQDPYGSLNPRMTLIESIMEPIQVHFNLGNEEATKKAMQLFHEVGLPNHLVAHYPHELSGGQRQRVAIARALSTDPKILIADEPVSALDVTIQAQILELLVHLSRQRSLSMIFVSHDLAVIEYLCDRVMVMKDGEIIESKLTKDLFSSPDHPYTRKLIASIPRIQLS